MKKIKTGRKSLFLSFFSVVVLLITTFAGYSVTRESPLPFMRRAEAQLLDSTFRIDISTITVTFDYFPLEYYVDCQALVEFTMRPGQSMAVIHLQPAIRDSNVKRRGQARMPIPHKTINKTVHHIFSYKYLKRRKNGRY